ncbi:MAG: sugar phosphate nucleotidyltransferase [Thermodesulfobacteriota bacterium]|nr:sugar phosphate nucleotidyltransferase [Thermodesulfobacteriota bacterium]
MNEALVMLLAGGVGSRLNIMVEARAKPAVPFGGIYRIIDFTLSNVMNSGINNVAVLTQYKPLSLMEHIGTGAPWDFIGRGRGAKILPPRTGQKDSDWYKGTADAMRQNIDYINSHPSREVLVLSGDHIYYMNYRPMIQFHRKKRADMTIAMMTVPMDQIRHFGTALTDQKGRIMEWEEKPEIPRTNLASMGIYVFKTSYLLSILQKTGEHDFGKHIIPMAINKDAVYAYPFQGYWRDVGTLDAYWKANMDLLNPLSGLSPEAWGVRPNLEEAGLMSDWPPANILPGAKVSNSVISAGCVIEGTVEHSVLSPGVYVARGAKVKDSVIMHECQIMAGSRIAMAILDKKVKMGKNVIVGSGPKDTPNQEFPEQLFTGLTIIGKKTALPAGVCIGPNSIVYPGCGEADFGQKEVSPGSVIRPLTP